MIRLIGWIYGGLEAYVVYDKNSQTVTIVVPIQYDGPGATPETIEKFNNGIKEEWTGQFGPYTVITEVTTSIQGKSSNIVTITDGNGRAKSSDNSGAFGTPGMDSRPGHLIGLQDRYDPETGKPNEGWENNIMASQGGKVDERNIKDIIEINQGGNSNGSAAKAHEPTGYASKNACAN
jgi:hypothetical protein